MKRLKNSKIFESLPRFYPFYPYFFRVYTLYSHARRHFAWKEVILHSFRKKIEKRSLFNWFWFWLKSFWNFISYLNARDFTSFLDYVTWNEIKFYSILFWNERKTHFISFHTITLLDTMTISAEFKILFDISS